jgi:hypothetical protein
LVDDCSDTRVWRRPVGTAPRNGSLLIGDGGSGSIRRVPRRVSTKV